MEPAPQIPSVLYHYCPSAALPEILRTGVFWLTHAVGLNDVREHNWPIPFIKRQIKSRRTDANAKLLDEIAKQLVLTLAHHVFVGSFSSEGDVLSQWRAYASDGDGFAIGFRTDAFNAKLQIPNASINNNHTVGFLQVQYNDDALKRAIEKVFDYYLTVDPRPGDAIIICAEQLRRLALSFKNPAFREENEWRISYSPWITVHPEKPDLEILGALKTMHFRSSRYGVVPYFELPFGLANREDAIAEIVIGPRNRSQLMEMHLLALGYRNARVRRSSASYR